MLPLEKEFYANLKGMVNDKVFVKGEWTDFSSLVLNELHGSPDHNNEEYTKLLEEGVGTDQVKEVLRQEGKEVFWKTGKKMSI